jgi:hypothetical protein
MAPVLGLFPIGFTGQRNAALCSFAVLFIRDRAPPSALAVWTGAGRDPRKSFACRRAWGRLVGGTLLTEGAPEAIAADERVRAGYLGEDTHG